MLVLKGDFIRENQPDRDNKPLVYGKSLRLRRDHARNPGIRIRHWGALVSLRAFLWQNAFDRRKPISPSRNSGSGFFFCGNVLIQFIWLPWSILQALSATLFLYIGQVIRKHGLLEEDSIEPICWLFMAGIRGYSALRFGKLYMVTNTYANGTQDVIGSVFGSLVILKLCQMACKHIPSATKPIAWIGKYTLPLFCMHLIELNVFPYHYSICFRYCREPSVSAVDRISDCPLCNHCAAHGHPIRTSTPDFQMVFPVKTKEPNWTIKPN